MTSRRAWALALAASFAFACSNDAVPGDNPPLAPPVDRNNNGIPDVEEDKDLDGVPDGEEDRNQNGIPDRMEDKDGDGIPDSVDDNDGDAIPDPDEDRNQNGTVDPGETNPATTDSDGDGVPDDQEVGYQACSRVNDRPIRVYDAPGAGSMIMVDAAVSEHSTLRTPDNRAPAMMLADSSLSLAAVLISKRPSAGVRSPGAQRELERRTSLASLGEVGALQTRAFNTTEGYPAEQASFEIRAAMPLDARTAAARIASAILGGATLTGALPASGPADRVLTVRLLTILRSPDQVVMVAAFGAGQPSDPQLMRLEEFSDGTNVARHGSYTRHVCDQFEARAQAKADIIFVVDDSGSMEDDQQAVREASLAMESVLNAAQLDFRLGVARHRARDRMNSADRGRLEGAGLTADINDFKQSIVVGAEGGWEPGLEVGIRAIDRLLPRTPEGAPADPQKLRDGAATVIVHLSDERDQTVECIACGSCEAHESDQTFCNQGNAQPVINNFIQQYQARNAVNFAIVGDLPNGCRQTSTRDDFEPGQGYVEVANATGGQFGSLCGNMERNLRDVARVIGGVASAYRLSVPPASASLKVAIGRPGAIRVIARSRVNGYDYDAVQNSIVFYGDSRPVDGDEVVVGYRRWDWGGDPNSPLDPTPNDPHQPPGDPYAPPGTPGTPGGPAIDGCERCAQYTTCDAASDLVECVPLCGDQICATGQACIMDSAMCGDPNQTPPGPTDDACGGCGTGSVCDPGPERCVPTCESSGCANNLICNTVTHLCEIPSF
jgi:hypothetical protein